MKKKALLVSILAFLLMMLLPMRGTVVDFHIVNDARTVLPCFFVSWGMPLSPIFGFFYSLAYNLPNPYYFMMLSSVYFHDKFADFEHFYILAINGVYLIGFLVSALLLILGAAKKKDFFSDLSTAISLGVCTFAIPFEILYLTSGRLSGWGIAYVSVFLVAYALLMWKGISRLASSFRKKGKKESEPSA